jgi:hypothetical protein
MFAVAALALLAPVMASKAQVSFGVAAGASIPSGDFGKSFDTGYNLTGMLGVSPPLSPVGFRVDGMYNEFNGKSNIFVSGQKERVSAITANAIVKAPVSAIVLSPYLIGGLGEYFSKFSTAGSTTSNDFGFNIGAGLKFGLAGFDALGEVRYHQFTTKGSAGNFTTKFIPITFGIMF